MVSITGTAASAASAVSSVATVAAHAAISAKDRAVQVMPADAIGLAREAGGAGGHIAKGAAGAAGEICHRTGGVVEQAAGHAAGALQGAQELSAHQLQLGKERMEKMADNFADLLEGFLKRKLQSFVKIFVKKIPGLLKTATDDVEMPKCVKRGKDATIDAVWPDIEQEIMWDLALKMIDGSGEDEHPKDYHGCIGCRAFFRYHLYPYDRGLWGSLKDPVWLLFTAIALLPIYGISPCVFLLIFLIIDKTDEFQLVSFILQFKGFQYLTQGVLRSLVGYFLFLSCVTSPGSQEHFCAQSGPGSAAPMILVVVGFGLQTVLAWIAFLLLPCSSKRGRGTLKGHLDHVETGSAKLQGGYILYLLGYDLTTFAISVAALLYTLYLRNWMIEDWPVKHAFYTIQMVHGLLSMPFFFFMIPFLRNVLLHSAPTAYDRFGRCRRYQGPERPRDPKGGAGLPARMLEKAEALRVLENLKSLLAGGRVQSLGEEILATRLGKASEAPNRCT
ncbi:unnamed protein product [Effrenium voratum]|nr:unnamed protein product [Effrenium voratum]